MSTGKSGWGLAALAGLGLVGLWMALRKDEPKDANSSSAPKSTNSTPKGTNSTPKGTNSTPKGTNSTPKGSGRIDPSAWLLPPNLMVTRSPEESVTAIRNGSRCAVLIIAHGPGGFATVDKTAFEQVIAAVEATNPIGIKPEPGQVKTTWGNYKVFYSEDAAVDPEIFVVQGRRPNDEVLIERHVERRDLVGAVTESIVKLDETDCPKGWRK